MSQSSQPERISIHNEESIRTLARAITYSQGEFSLILARCNYASLRENMMQKLRQYCTVEIQQLELSLDSKTLYTAIVHAIGDERPQALVVFGLELVHALDAVLASTNQVREEFRKAFAFPLVLWINDTILKKLIKQVPDLESWASVVEFEIPQNNLMAFLQKTSDEVFEEFFDVGAAPFLLRISRELGTRSRLSMELELAKQDVQNQGLELSVGLTVSLEFLLGLSHASSMEESRRHYEQSLSLWPADVHPERQGCVCYQLGLWWRTYAVQHRSEYESFCLQAIEYYQRAIAIFEKACRPDLVAKFINPLGEALQRLKQWEALEPIARKSLSLNEAHPNLYRQAEASGFLAEALLGRSIELEAKQTAEQALQLLETAIGNESSPPSTERQGYIDWQKSFSRGWHLFTLGRVQWQLGQHQDAIRTLETARVKTRPDYDPLLYIQILRQLRKCYFEQKDYLKAFDTRLEYRSLEQQYGFRAFVGAGRLQPQREVLNPALIDAQAKQQDKVSQEIAASGRQESVNRLIERLSRADQKLIVLHGQSGVGKSSIIQAGLIPSLTPITLDTRQVITILQQVYANWTVRLGREMLKTLKSLGFASLPQAMDSPPVILEQLRKSVDQNLMVVLIFDQFEEFFFVHKEPIERKPFYGFLRECLNIPYVKVILSLREDYLHYLLECNDRLVSLDIISNNILDKNVLFHLGNFTREDAKSVIHTLTKDTPYPLSTDLTEELVKDLSEELGEVRPIELQVVGAQLQTEQITTLEQYKEKGPKDALVSRFLDEVTHDCGPENEEIARLVLYLLTDENNTRPLKTREDIELEVNVSEKLDLILTILVRSGLVFRIPSSPSDRYQLVHDYLVVFVRQTQSTQLIAELEKEREQRQLTEKQLSEALQEKLRTARRATLTLAGLVTAVTGVALLTSLAFINTSISSKTNSSAQEKEVERVVSALEAGKLHKGLPGIMPEVRLKTLSELSQATNSARVVNEMKEHTDEITDISLSNDGQLMASSSNDNTVIIWHANGSRVALMEHPAAVNCIEFSPDGNLIATGADDGFVRLWNTNGNLVREFKDKHSGGVSSIAFSPDGEKIVSGGIDSILKIWNHSGNLIKLLEGHKTAISNIHFNSDGSRLATFAEFDPVIIWDINKLIKLTTLESSHTINLSFKSESERIEVIDKMGQVHLFNFNRESLGMRYISYSSFPPNFEDISPYEDTRFFASIEAENKDKIRISSYYGESFELLHKDEVIRFEIDSKNDIIVSADKTNRLTIWSTKEIRKDLDKRGSQRINSSELVRLSPDLKAISLDETTNTLLFRNNFNETMNKILSINGSILSFSSDKNFFISDRINHLIKVWKFEENQVKINEPLDLDSFNVVSPSGFAASNDGQLIVAGDRNGFLKLWTMDGDLLFSHKAHHGKIIGVAISPDKQRVISADSNTLKVWDSEGNLINEIIFPGEEFSWIKIVFSPDSQKFVLIKNSLATLLSSDGRLISSLDKHPGPVYSADFSPDGETILTISPYDRFGDRSSVNIWNSNGQLRDSIDTLGIYSYFDNFSPDGQEIYSKTFYHAISRFSPDGKVLEPLEGHLGGVTRIVYSPDGEFIATSSEDGTIRLWERTGKLIRILRGHNVGITGLDISTDSQKIVSIDREGVVKLWNRNEETAFATIDKYALDYADTYSSVSFSKGGNTIILQGNYYISILNFSGEKVVESQFGQFVNLLQARDNSNSKVLISINQNPTLELWSTGGELLTKLGGHATKVNSISISPNRQKIASASKDNTVRLWDAYGNLLRTIEHKEDVNSVSFSKDGKLLATASDDELIRIFDENGDPILDEQGNELKLTGHTNHVTSVLFSPDGKTLASASTDNTIRLWNINTWKQEGKEFEIPGTNNGGPGSHELDALWFSEDGNLLAYGTDPTYVRLLNRSFGNGTWVKDAIFHPLKEIPEGGLPDSKHWLTVRGNKGVIVLSLGLAHSLTQACEWVIDHLRTNDNENDDNLCGGILN